MRLLGARLGAGQPVERQVEFFLKLQLMRDLGLIVGGQREDQRALVAQFHIDAARAQQLLGKSGQRAWLSRPSATSASSPGSASQQAANMPAAAWLAPIPALPRSNTDTGAGSEPPGDAKADHARADNRDARPFADDRWKGRRSTRLPSLE